MPHMKMHESGGIVFIPTKEEKELRQLRSDLKKEIEDAKKLKEELAKALKSISGGD